MMLQSWQRSFALGVLTGMRSMSGLAAVAVAHRRSWAPLAILAAAGEMVADKTPFVGDRIEAAPLIARMVTGAIAGSVAADEHGDDWPVPGLVAAVTALAATHAAFRARRSLPQSNLAGGLLEDALAISLALAYVQAHPRRAAE